MLEISFHLGYDAHPSCARSASSLQMKNLHHRPVGGNGLSSGLPSLLYVVDI